MTFGEPAQDVDFLRVGQTASQRVGNDLKQGVCGKIFVVVDVGLDDNTRHATEGGFFFFLECELDIGFAELNLRPPRRCAKYFASCAERH